MKQLDLIDDFLFKQKTRDIQLFIAKDDKNHPVLCVVNTSTGKRTLLKKFYGKYKFHRFLIEAVLLRLIADKASSKKALNCYYNLAKFLKDENEKTFN